MPPVHLLTACLCLDASNTDEDEDCDMTAVLDPPCTPTPSRFNLKRRMSRSPSPDISQAHAEHSSPSPLRATPDHGHGYQPSVPEPSPFRLHVPLKRRVIQVDQADPDRCGEPSVAGEPSPFKLRRPLKRRSNVPSAEHRGTYDVYRELQLKHPRMADEELKEMARIEYIQRLKDGVLPIPENGLEYTFLVR